MMDLMISTSANPRDFPTGCIAIMETEASRM